MIKWLYTPTSWSSLIHIEMSVTGADKTRKKETKSIDQMIVGTIGIR